MTKEFRLLGSALLALLALVVIRGSSLAAGDLFDHDYTDCPVRSRKQDDRVSWAVTDSATRGLGPNAYNASPVMIRDDGASRSKALCLVRDRLSLMVSRRVPK